MQPIEDAQFQERGSLYALLASICGQCNMQYNVHCRITCSVSPGAARAPLLSERAQGASHSPAGRRVVRHDVLW